MSNRIKLPKRIQQALSEVDKWRLDTSGKTVRIYVNEILAGVVPHNTRGDGQDNGRALFNVVAQIRRAARVVPA